MLPAPSSERWKPLRAGLVDMFYYDIEEFQFHDGRLLLRGNNGTGKSKVLALTLPFLLDGELAPHRVEPDGDRQKKMEWNLLLGGKHPHAERLGYAWLEFGRRAADGTAHFRTLGCGLKAVGGRGIARHWFFVTTQRVGEQLQLLPTSRVPLTREKLREEIACHGLDEERDALRALEESRQAANDFLRHYSRYAMIAAKRKAARPRQAQSRYEQLGRDLSAAEEAFAAANDALETAQHELAELEQERTRLQAQREAL